LKFFQEGSSKNAGQSVSGLVIPQYINYRPIRIVFDAYIAVVILLFATFN